VDTGLRRHDGGSTEESIIRALGITCYPSLAALPEMVDAAFFGVPASSGRALLEQAADAGIDAVFINANGYADGDEDGKALQR
jgi:acyl-CoA synthetase (NDP forming)